VEVQGNARQLEQLASAHAEQWTAFCARLSEVTGQPLEQLLDDADRGRFFSAEEAIDYGLVDEVAAADARMYRLPGRPIGFGSV
jgi:ATP-dependent Clp protease protease subunit